MLHAKRRLWTGFWLYLALVACTSLGPGDIRLQGWWRGLGPVMPHDSFPADCSLCHLGGDWNTIRADFEFDHTAETGYALEGAHEAAQCLRCHNDRGPVQVFAARDCAGCHEDVHVGQLGSNCRSCHLQDTWRPFGMREMHASTRFPLVGRHATASCRACHLGAEVGRFAQTDSACVSCHRRDLEATANPNHIGLGWVDNCDRCHVPTTWHQAQFVPN